MTMRRFRMALVTLRRAASAEAVTSLQTAARRMLAATVLVLHRR